MLSLPPQSAADALKILGDLYTRKAPLRMSHLYRGTLLTQDISLITFCPERVLARIQKSGLVVVPEEAVYLHSPVIEEVLGARVLDTDARTNHLELGNFICTGRPWVARGYERVQPCGPVRAILHVGESSLSVALENISMIGAGLLIYKLAERGIELRPGQPVRLDFSLPEAGIHLALLGRVVNLLSPGGYITCVGINTYPNVEQARLLEGYIAQRKVEIASEMDRILIEAFEPQSVKQLYF